MGFVRQTACRFLFFLESITSVSFTVNQSVWLITDCVRRTTGHYRNQNTLETARHWNDPRQGKQKSPQWWWLIVGSLWISLCQLTICTVVLHTWHFTLSADYFFFRGEAVAHLHTHKVSYLVIVIRRNDWVRFWDNENITKRVIAKAP